MDGDNGVLLPINRIAEKLNLPDDDLEFYGRYTAKIRLGRLPGLNAPTRGKLILVTAITPTSHGEGKTVVSIGLAQAIEKLGKRSIVTLREPSLGPVFGVKGGASGAGFIVVVTGNMMLIPGLSKTPQAARMNVDRNGRITGLS